MMKRILFVSVVLISIMNIAVAQQAKITGKVMSSKTGEVLIGATVSIEGTKKSTQTDQNGLYSISGLNKGTYKVITTYVSYTTKTMSVEVAKIDEVVYQDIVIDRAGDMSSVVIKSSGGGANKPKETVSSLLIAQKNSASVSDGISAETIKRTPDRNTGDILKRVSGASLQEDKFAVVRGLNDRYNAAFLNGAPLPSSESDRKAFAFDIFPANMLDNLIIYKTATPDMPGEFAGGQIVINTKGIPTENFQSFTIGMGANTKATFQPRKYYDGGQFDFLGIDNTRKLPSDLPGITEFKALSLNDRITYAKSFQPKNWGMLSKATLPNTSLQYVIGRNIQRKEKDFLGIIFSVVYNKSFTHNDGERKIYAGPLLQSYFYEDFYNTQTLCGAIGNISLKINNNHSISLKNIYSINADDKVITRDGQGDLENADNRYSKSFALWFTSNKIASSQLIGEHYLPGSKIKFNWVASYSDIQRDVPALRRMFYDSIANAGPYQAKLYDPNPVDNDNTAGLTFYSKTKESLKNIKIDISRNVKFGKNIQSTFKIGAYYQTRDRSFSPRLLAFCNFNSSRLNYSLLSLSPDKIFAKSSMGYLSANKTGFTLKDITETRDIYTASADLLSYYAMADQRFGKSFRLIYGVRVEDFTQKLNAEYNAFTKVRINTNKVDVLPSVNAVYSINTKQNLRFCYSKTLNRPEFRELAPFLFRDYTIKYSVFGDTGLIRASIDNYDFRYEYFPGKAQMISASLFYKKFKDPIELIAAETQDATLTYKNTPSATLKGIEFEIRSLLGTFVNAPTSSIWNKLTFFGNLSILKSKVNIKTTDSTNFYFTKGRVLQGQSPYVINAGLTYQDDEKDITSTISVNRYGQRVFLANNGITSQSGQLLEANLFENGRTVLDFQITKAFPKKSLELKLNVKDILAQQLFFFEDNNDNAKYDKDADVLRSTLNYGRTINFSLTYKFK